ENRGFILTVNVAGNLSLKAIDIKAEGFPMKVNFAGNYGTFFMSLKFQLISWAWRNVDHKTVMLYNKVSFIQIYNDYCSTESKEWQAEAKANGYQDTIAECREIATSVGMKMIIMT